MSDKPQWERGVNMHGYWLGSKRVGWVGRDSDGDGYGWGLDANINEEATAPTLRQAKRAVEQAWTAARKPEGEEKL